MPVHITTGNRLDLIEETDEQGRTTVVGLQPWGAEKMIPLPDPEGLLRTLEYVLARARKVS